MLPQACCRKLEDDVVSWHVPKLADLGDAQSCPTDQIQTLRATAGRDVIVQSQSGTGVAICLSYCPETKEQKNQSDTVLHPGLTRIGCVSGI